ncbi:SAM-dependent methyltransferase [Amycolatopsis magusensis]|uniref:SAM-dependent methyltransferase n=1 Tax=Amycolatopsis magusensis TaxID=882444 RepID=UPI0024A9383A|nr:SAM-dependent methyltransferase [Amycolatopsis magusensis]MDI5979826.1 SAM-dependent methyltransferase [Amycolatopsis magusensis]
MHRAVKLRPSADGAGAPASIARVYDAAVNGRDHYAADRALLTDLDHVAPGFRELLRAQDRWRVRAVRALAMAGYDQFIDCDAGLPRRFNTHDIVRRYNSESRVLYTDTDPVVVAHGRTVLDDGYLTRVEHADPTAPQRLLARPHTENFLDRSKPIAILHTTTFNFGTPAEYAATIMAGYRDALAPGSAVALTQWWTAEADAAANVRKWGEIWAAYTGLDARFRSAAEITDLFTGFHLMPPGLVELDSWWPDGPDLIRHAYPPALAGIGYTPDTTHSSAT